MSQDPTAQGRRVLDAAYDMEDTRNINVICDDGSRWRCFAQGWSESLPPVPGSIRELQLTPEHLRNREKLTWKTTWHCEACGTNGTIWHSDNADVYSVTQSILRDHANLRSVLCETDLMKIRVRLHHPGER